MLTDYQSTFFVYRRASYPVYCKFGINKFELQALCMLAAYLRSQGRQIVSRDVFMDAVTANSRERAKILGYLTGCIDKKFLQCYEYISHPDSLSIGFSDLGIHVVTSFERDMKTLLDRYEPKIDFSKLAINPTKPGRYKLRSAA